VVWPILSWVTACPVLVASCYLCWTMTCVIGESMRLGMGKMYLV
jgi:hypothetical protein